MTDTTNDEPITHHATLQLGRVYGYMPSGQDFEHGKAVPVTAAVKAALEPVVAADKNGAWVPAFSFAELLTDALLRPELGAELGGKRPRGPRRLTDDKPADDGEAGRMTA